MNSELNTRTDVIVIGGGVIGLSLALELARRERKVLVLERGLPGRAATWAAGGMLAPVAEADVEEATLIDFGIDSLQRYPAFVAELERLSRLSCGYRSEGTLWVATNRDDREELDHVERTLTLKGLDYAKLGADELLQREPHLSSRVLGGLYLQNDHQVDPRALVRALERAVSEAGGVIATETTVAGVEATPEGEVSVEGVDVSGQFFTAVAPQAVVAAGVWSDEEIHPSLERLRLRPVKGQLLRLRGPSLLDHVLRTPDVYMVPRANGELLIGATVEEMGFDNVPTGGAVMDLLRDGWQVLPGIYDLAFSEVSVGLRSAVDDHLPVIGPWEIDGLFLAVGHYRNGILLAPATAHYLAEWMVEGRQPQELAPFLPQRLAGAQEPEAEHGGDV